MIHTLTERHLLSMMASAALLRRIGRIDFDERSASFFRFARELGKEYRPRGICNALGKTMMMDHAVHLQVFHTDDAEPVNNLTAFLVGEVLPSPVDTLMDSCHDLPMLPSLWCALSKLGVLALYPGKSFLFLAEKSGVLYLGSIRHGGKGVESYVNADLGRHIGQAFRLALYREGDVPLPRRRAMERTGFDLTLDGPMVDHLDGTDLGETDPIVMRDTEARLREGETMIAALAFETRESRLFGMLFAATEEGFERQINTHRHVLQDLGMHCIKRGTHLFQDRECFLLLIERQSFPILLIGCFALFEQVVIEPTALFKRFVQLVKLFPGGGYPILKHFTHMHVLYA